MREKSLEFVVEVGLHLQQLEAEHLRVDGDRMIAPSGGDRFLDEIVGLDSLFGDGMGGELEDVTLSPVTDQRDSCHKYLAVHQRGMDCA